MPAPPSPAPEIAFAERFSPLAAFAWCAIPTLLGLAIAVAGQLTYILPKFGTGSTDLNRMVALGLHLKQPYGPAAVAAAVGDSVTVEGIDAGIVASNAPPGWTVENIGINGCDRAEVNVILPRVLQARPKAVIFVLRPLSIAAPPPISADGAYAYALGGFREQWPAGWITPESPGLTPDLYERLTSTEIAAKIHFRTALSNWANDSVRERIRKGIKFARPDNWVAPFNMSMSISGAHLESHLHKLEEEVREAAAAPEAVGPPTDGKPSPFVLHTAKDEADMERLIALTRAQGAIPVLIAAPIHPGLRNAEAFGAVAHRLRELAPAWSARYGGVYADASDLLDESGFADGQHLNARGRELLSAFVGKSLPPPKP